MNTADMINSDNAADIGYVISGYATSIVAVLDAADRINSDNAADIISIVPEDAADIVTVLYTALSAAIIIPHNATNNTPNLNLAFPCNATSIVAILNLAFAQIITYNATYSRISTDITSVGAIFDSATIVIPHDTTDDRTVDIAGVAAFFYGSIVTLPYNAAYVATAIDRARIAAIFNDTTKVVPHDATDSGPLDFASIMAVGDHPSVLSANSADIISTIDAAIDGKILHTALASVIFLHCTNYAKKSTVITRVVNDIETANRAVFAIKGASVRMLAGTNRRPRAILFAAEVDVVHQLRIGRWLCSFIVCAIDEIAKGCEIFCIVDQKHVVIVLL